MVFHARKWRVRGKSNRFTCVSTPAGLLSPIPALRLTPGSVPIWLGWLFRRP